MNENFINNFWKINDKTILGLLFSAAKENPQKIYWSTGGVFTTPPGLWHSHVNESDKDAYVLPVQDAGLYTYQRTLDIQFSK